MTVPTPHSFIRSVIDKWEGKLSVDPVDSGNWCNGVLVGSMYGVTPPVLAAHRGIDPATVTRDMIQTVTLDEAAEIGVKNFYQDNHFDMLPWGPATASLVDWAWGSGPATPIEWLQRETGVTIDGNIGPQTAGAYIEWEREAGWVEATKLVHDARFAFYKRLGETNPDDERYVVGWDNRDDWASAANKEWWASWGVT